LEGDEFGLVTIPKSEFSDGLTQTKAKTISRVSQVAGLGRVQVEKPS
jgi:hypothetical protein